MEGTWRPSVERVPALVRPVRPGDVGGPTPAVAKGPKWRRTSRGFYVPADVDGSVPEQRIMEQAARLPEGAAVTGWAALRLYGASFFDGLDRPTRQARPVPLALGTIRAKPQQGATLLRGWFPADGVALRHGIPCVPPAWALFEEMRSLPLRAAVVAMDMTSAAYLTSVGRETAYVRGLIHQRGRAHVLQALALARDGAASPTESGLRLFWVLDLGLPEPLINQPVFDLHGNLLGIVDLFDPELGLACEYDGAVHRNARRHASDVAREDRFRDAGVEVVRVTGPDLAHPDRIADRILAGRRRATAARATPRGWTLDPPEDWIPGMDVESHLDHLDWLARTEPPKF